MAATSIYDPYGLDSYKPVKPAAPSAPLLDPNITTYADSFGGRGSGSMPSPLGSGMLPSTKASVPTMGVNTTSAANGIAAPVYSWGTGGDPTNTGTMAPGRYTGEELAGFMNALPTDAARYAFFLAMNGMGQGGNDLQTRWKANLGSPDAYNQWINAQEYGGPKGYFNPVTGEVSYYSGNGPTSDPNSYVTTKVPNWNGSAYAGTSSSYFGSYGGTPATSAPAPGGTVGGGLPATGGGATGAPAGGGAAVGGGSVPSSGGALGVNGGTLGGGGAGSTGATGTALEAKARAILGSYFITRPDGTPDWNAMSGSTDFYNSLPDAIKQAITNEHLGAAMRTEAGLPLLSGMTLPDWYGKAGSGVQNTGVFTPAVYNAPTYTAPTSPAVSPGNPMDFFNEEGYKFRLNEGKDAIQNSAAARGGLMSGATLKELENYASGLAAQEYGAAFDRFANTRNFNRGVFESDRGFGRNAFESDRNFGRNTYESDRNFDFGNYKDLRDYLESVRRFDTGASNADRDYLENQRRWDLNFDRDTASGDRSFSWGTLKDLANMGLQSEGLTAQQRAALAALLSSNTIAGGNAAAGGTIGSSNANNAMMNAIMQYILGNNMVNAINP